MELVLRQIHEYCWALHRHALVREAIERRVHFLLDQVAREVLVGYANGISLPHVANLVNKSANNVCKSVLLSRLANTRIENLREGQLIEVDTRLN